MKLNEPISDCESLSADLQYRQDALNQRKQAAEIAERLRNGEQLTDLERGFAAILIARGAETISTDRPRSKGAPKKVPEEARWLFAQHKAEGLSDAAAMRLIADLYGLPDVDSVKYQVGKKGTRAHRDECLNDIKGFLPLAKRLHTLKKEGGKTK